MIEYPLMHPTKKAVLIMLSGLIVIFAVCSLFFISPFKKAVSLIESKKKEIEVGINAVKMETQLKKAVEKKEEFGIDVLHYGINLDLFPSKEKIKGDVTIKMALTGTKSKNIELDFYDNMKISKVSVDNDSVGYKRNDNILSILTNPNWPDTVNVRIVYQGSPKSLGFGSFNFVDENDKEYVYTMNEPFYASTWFPCVDIPTDKALLDISITNDSSMVSLSNGKLISKKTSGSRSTYHWKTFYPISTYLITVYSADYKSRTQKYISTTKDTIDLVCYATPDKFDDMTHDFSDHANYMKVFEQMFGPYPFPKEKYGLAEFWWDYGAMENQTITGIGSQFISGHKFFADMMIHELSHHWWGDAVTVKSWKDIWLNEGFATYSEALYWEKKSGFDALKSTLASKFSSFGSGTLYNPIGNLFGRMIYDKGAWVLHMLRKEIGDENFFNLLKQYFEIYKYKNVSTEDLRHLSEKISGKNLKKFFDQWVYKGVGIINLDYKWEVKENPDGYAVNINYEQTQDGYSNYNFPLDIKFLFNKEKEPEVATEYVNSRKGTFTIQLKFKPVKMNMDPDKWLLATFNNID